MPTFTFQVNLSTVSFNTSKQPYNQYVTGEPGEGVIPAVQDSVNFPSTRSTWFPNNLNDNRKLTHGAQFTAKDFEGLYLNNNFTTGPNAFLTLISVTNP